MHLANCTAESHGGRWAELIGPGRRQPRGAESWAAPWVLGLFTLLLSWGRQVPTRHFLQTSRQFTGKGVDPEEPQGSGFWTRVPRRPFLISRNTRGFLVGLQCDGQHLVTSALTRMTNTKLSKTC